MNAKMVRSSLVSLTLAIGALGASSLARATECYGCYDDANGKEQCKSVQVQGQCNVITFCQAAGCGSGASPRLGLSAKPRARHSTAPQKLGARPAAAEAKFARPGATAPAGRPAAAGDIQAPSLANCTSGFSKTDENTGPTGVVSSFDCTTPILRCPNNPTFPNKSLDVDILNENPEMAQLRIRYTCSYYPAIP
jgi:hypothetical protein